jgi:hypothetical protein
LGDAKGLKGLLLVVGGHRQMMSAMEAE